MTTSIFKDRVHDEEELIPNEDGVEMAFYITADGYSDLLEEEDILNFYSNTVIQTWIADEHDPDHTTPER